MIWDERRNTSRVFAVPPDALPAALAALRTIPADLREWIEAGAPRLSVEEHRERFGCDWKTAASRRGSKR